MKEKNKRNMFLKIRVSEEEMAAIKRKQQNSGIPTVSDFVRTMIFRGVIIYIDKIAPENYQCFDFQCCQQCKSDCSQSKFNRQCLW